MAPTNPGEPTLTVARAAQVLGVHPNTLRAWSDLGRIPYLRINDRGDRRYRLADLRRFLDAAERRPERDRRRGGPGPRPAPAVLPIGPDVVEERTRPHDVRVFPGSAMPGSAAVSPSYARLVRIAPGEPPDITRAEVHARETDVAANAEGPWDGTWDGTDRRRPSPGLVILGALLSDLGPGRDPLDLMTAAVELLHDRAGHDLVAILRHEGGTLTPRIARGVGASRLDSMPVTRGLAARALASRAVAIETAPPPHVDEWLAPGRLLHGRIVAPIGFGEPWGILVVGDEGSSAVQGWAPIVEAVARVLAAALGLAAAERAEEGRG